MNVVETMVAVFVLFSEFLVPGGSLLLWWPTTCQIPFKLKIMYVYIWECVLTEYYGKHSFGFHLLELIKTVQSLNSRYRLMIVCIFLNKFLYFLLLFTLKA